MAKLQHLPLLIPSPPKPQNHRIFKYQSIQNYKSYYHTKSAEISVLADFGLYLYLLTYLLVLVLVVDERGSFSAVGAHIFPSFIKTVLEDVD